MKKLLTLLILSVSLNAFAADGAYNTTTRTDSAFSKSKSEFVIGGYDVVAYFAENAEATKGSEKFEHKWSGGSWLFSSQANLDLFAANPEKYAPQYGGYCAWAVAKDSTAEINPTQFTIIDDKLYLNYNSKIQGKWSKNPTKYIKDANENWTFLLEDLLEE